MTAHPAKPQSTRVLLRRVSLLLLLLSTGLAVGADSRADVCPFRVGSETGGYRYGFIDAGGRVVAPPEYELPLWRFFGASEYLAVVRDGRAGLLNRRGEMVVGPSFDMIFPDPFFGDGGPLPALGEGMLFGFITPPGEWVVPPRFRRVESFSGDRPALVVLDGKTGFIDGTGGFVVPPIYDAAEPFHLGEIVQARRDGKVGYIDATGAVRVPFAYEAGDVAFFGEWAAVRRDGMWGYVDSRGVETVPCAYEAVTSPPFLDAEAAGVKRDGEWRFILKDGAEASASRYGEIGALRDDGPLTLVKAGGKWGYVDKRAREVVPPRFVRAGSFSRGRAAVAVECPAEGGGAPEIRYGYIDALGEWVVEPRFERAERYSDFGLAPVRVSGKWGLIDMRGETVLPPTYDGILVAGGMPYFQVRLGGNMWMLDESLQVFDELAVYENGLTQYMRDGRGGYRDAAGETVFRLEDRDGVRVGIDRAGVEYPARY